MKPGMSLLCESFLSIFLSILGLNQIDESTCIVCKYNLKFEKPFDLSACKIIFLRSPGFSTFHDFNPNAAANPIDAIHSAIDLGNPVNPIDIVKKAPPAKIKAIIHDVFVAPIGVGIGAHPSFNDPKNFGRERMYLTSSEVKKLIYDQYDILQNISIQHGQNVTHMKPHGALNNMACEDFDLATTISKSINNIDKNIRVFRLFFLALSPTKPAILNSIYLSHY